jgi:hypothetical protein
MCSICTVTKLKEFIHFRKMLLCVFITHQIGRQSVNHTFLTFRDAVLRYDPAVAMDVW